MVRNFSGIIRSNRDGAKFKEELAVADGYYWLAKGSVYCKMADIVNLATRRRNSLILLNYSKIEQSEIPVSWHHAISLLNVNFNFLYKLSSLVSW